MPGWLVGPCPAGRGALSPVPSRAAPRPALRAPPAAEAASSSRRIRRTAASASSARACSRRRLARTPAPAPDNVTNVAASASASVEKRIRRRIYFSARENTPHDNGSVAVLQFTACIAPSRPPRLGAQQVPKGQMPILGRATEAPTRCRCSTSMPISSASGRSSGRCPRRRSDPAGPYSGHDDGVEGERDVLRSDHRGRRPERRLQDPRGDRVSQGQQDAGAAGHRLARLQLSAVRSGGRRPRRDLQHPFRKRAVHRQRQIGARAKRAALALATQLSSGELNLGGRRAFHEPRHSVVAKDP